MTGGSKATYPAEAPDRREEARLTEDEKKQLIAELPSWEELERGYREMQENGGLSFEEFFEPLLQEFEQGP